MFGIGVQGIVLMFDCSATILGLGPPTGEIKLLVSDVSDVQIPVMRAIFRGELMGDHKWWGVNDPSCCHAVDLYIDGVEYKMFRWLTLDSSTVGAYIRVSGEYGAAH